MASWGYHRDASADSDDGPPSIGHIYHRSRPVEPFPPEPARRSRSRRRPGVPGPDEAHAKRREAPPRAHHDHDDLEKGHRGRRKSRRKSENRRPSERSQSANEQIINSVDDVYFGGTSMTHPPLSTNPFRPSATSAFRPYGATGFPTQHYSEMEELAMKQRMDARLRMDTAQAMAAAGPDDDGPWFPLTRLEHDHFQKKYLWPRKTKSDLDATEKITIKIRLVLNRHGQRYRSEPFLYTKRRGANDLVLAQGIRQRYRGMKMRHVGFLQKAFAYKEISYVYVLRYQWITRPDSEGKQGRWETEQRPITSKDGKVGQDAFMYRLRSLVHGSENPGNIWSATVNDCIRADTVIDLQVAETFDSTKLYIGVLLGILLSLAAALLYGFLMDNDFATGFSIASWMITAFGFMAAVVAAGEYFGLESMNSFSAASEIEAEAYRGANLH